MADLREWVAEYNDEALLADGLEAAFVGVASYFGKEPVAVYDADKCVAIFMEQDGMDYDEAQEYFDFNVAGAYVGEYTPLYLTPYKGSE
jgi:hypothetical protein